jgi:hypothetical protein
MASTSSTPTSPSDFHTDTTPEFRVFPYENANLEPFENAVAALNPVVAVKVRSAAVHAALAEVCVPLSLPLFSSLFPSSAPDEKCIYVDANTRIQILDTILLLPTADREQCAAFIVSTPQNPLSSSLTLFGSAMNA